VDSVVVFPEKWAEYAIWLDNAVIFLMTVLETVLAPFHDGLLNKRMTLRISSRDIDIVGHVEGL